MTRTVERPRLAALITAAGASTRMGSPKALVPWRGVPLLLHQARVLATSPALVDLVAVLGAASDTIRHAAAAWDCPPLRLVDNPRWAEGRSTSLEVGATSLIRPCEAILIAAVDQPLDPIVLATLLDDFQPGDRALLPSHAGRSGHPVLLSAALLPELRTLTRLPEGLRTLVRAAAPRLVPVDSPSVHLDLNRPDDLAAAQITNPAPARDSSAIPTAPTPEGTR